jgi:3-deoxy-D-manno-octulosonic acid kinase
MVDRWPTGAAVRLRSIRGGAMLYDTSRAGNLDERWFDPQWWSQRGRLEYSSEGRGAALYIETDERRLVLRHYRRGGMAARISADRYLWQGASTTRSFAEWQLLYHLQQAGLPVPIPIAACYRRRRWTYTADLLIQRIDGVRSLATLLQLGPLSLTAWIAIGRCVRVFHTAGVCHADLNAHNVLLDESAAVWLVDFDRGRLRRPGFWCDGNLVRLRRSIEKTVQPLPPDRFSESDWVSLLDGYFAAAAPEAAV